MDANPERKLTLGEVIAFMRYSPRGGYHSVEDATAVLEFMDAIEVCTTCGYARAYHDTLVRDQSCAHFTRKF